MRKTPLVVFWEGEAVGEMHEMIIDNFHLSGRWVPRDSPKLEDFMRCFQGKDPEVIVSLGDETPTEKARMYEAPQEYIDVNMIPEFPAEVRQ